MNARMLVSERPQRVSRKRGAATRTGSYHRLPVTASPGVPRRCPRAAELGGGAPLRAWPARFALWHPRLVRRRRSRRGSGHRAKHLGRGFGPGATICCCSFSGRVAWRVAFVRGGGIFRNLPTQRHCRLYRSILVFRGGCYHCGDKYSKRILRCISALLMHLYFSSYQHKRRRTKNKSRNLVFGEGFLPRSVCCCLSSNKLYKEYRTTLYIHGHTCSHVSSFRYYIYKSNAQLNARNNALGGGGIRETEASSQFATLHRARRACVLERSAARPHGRTDGLIFKTDRLSAGSPSDRSESRSDQTEYGPVFTWGGLADKVRWVLLQGTPL